MRRYRFRYRVRPRLILILGVALAITALLVTRGHQRHLTPTTAPRPSAARTAAPPVATLPTTLAWHRASWSLTTPARGQAAVVGGGDLLLVGGLGGSSLGTVQVYGPHQLKLFLPDPVHDAGAVVQHGDLLVFGGGSAGPTPVIQAVPLPGGTIESPGPLPEPLADLTAVTIKDQVYLVGGYTGPTYNQNIYRWQATAPLAVAAVLPVGLRYAAVTVDGSSIIVAGGLTPSGLSAAVYAVNPASGLVTPWPSLPTALAYAAAAVYQGHVWVVGGQTTRGASARAFWYDPAQHMWVAGPSLPVATMDGTLTRFAHRLWYAGGETAAGTTAAVWELSS